MTAPPDIVTAPETEGDRIGRLEWLLARTADDGGLSPGDLAELRRLDPQGSLPPACWRLLVRFAPDSQEAERAWAILIGTVLLAGPRGPWPVGAVLADRDNPYAEPRFVRLLRARGLGEVAHEARQAARWCAVHGGGLRFTDGRARNGFGPFLLAAALRRDEAEDRGHAIARDYFLTLRRAERAQET